MPGWIGSQQACGVPLGMAWMPRPPGGANAAGGGRPGGERGAGLVGDVCDDEPGRAARSWLVSTVTGRAEDAAAVVAAPVVAAARAQKHVPAGAAVLRGGRGLLGRAEAKG